MMKKRIISGVLGFLVLFFMITAGGKIWDISVFVISLIAVYEFNKAISKIDNLRPIKALSYLLSLGLLIICLTNTYNELKVVLFLYTITLLIMLVLDDRVKLQDIAVTFFGGIYISFFIFHMAFLDNKLFIWLALLTGWSTDTLAYFSGMLFGKRKLCPKLSPKKTVEGAVGGTIGCVICTIIFIVFFDLGNLFRYSILALICSIMAQFGDLTASRIKRLANIKDYGYIMPGHGGILDRFDSILFTAPIVYYFVKFFI